MRPNLLTRLALLEAAEPTHAWERGQGLSSLLAYARSQGLPKRDPWDVDEIADTGLGKLLREARLRQQEEGYQAHPTENLR
jgi:hypothetical protein